MNRERLATAIRDAATHKDRRLDDGFEWYDSAYAMADAILAELGESEEWRDHIPTGYHEGRSDYGQVECSCGWDSRKSKLGWEEHIDAAERMGRAIG